MKTYARAAKLGLEAQNHAAEIAILARRKAGEFLAQLDRNQGGNTKFGSSNVGQARGHIQENISSAGNVLSDYPSPTLDVGLIIQKHYMMPINFHFVRRRTL